MGIVGTAYSYIRFSSLKQERGDSVRRQETLRDGWLARHPSVTLDTSLTLADLGVSAYRGKHRTDDRSALTQFIRAVESGRVKPGSILIVESLDRLTREELGDAFELVLGLVNRGIRIVQLSPVESILEKPVNMVGLMLAVVELSRGNGESKRKHDLSVGAWDRLREAARSSGKIVSAKTKAWLTITKGKFSFKPGARDLIRRLVRMCADGHGFRAIARKLNEEKVPCWSGGSWGYVYVRAIVTGRAILGEYQPKLKRGPARVAEGAPIVGYYPAAVTEAEWMAAQVATEARTHKGGRPPKHGQHVNVFRGLLFDWATTAPLFPQWIRNQGGRRLVREGYHKRGESAIGFDQNVFETALLSQLAEVDPRELLDGADSPDEVAELSAKLARLDGRLKAMAEQFDDEDVIPEVAAKMKALNGERKAAAEKLAAAKVKAASPLSSAWGECKGLVETLTAAPDQRETRVRLRQAITRTVERVTCLFLPHKRDRLAVVRVSFSGGGVRVYTILHRPTSGNVSGRMAGRWWAHSQPLRGFELGGASPSRTTTGLDLFANPFVEHIPARSATGTVFDPKFVVPDELAKRFKAIAQGEGCTTGELV